MGSVLIVDDEANVRALLERILAEAGHELRTAADAESALQAIAHSTPDVVLSDVHMPGASGLWLADRIRDCAPATAVVLVTADGDVPPCESLRNGLVAYVLKPFQPKQVLRAVADGMQWAAATARKPPRSRAPGLLPAGFD
jgi:DNA-binding NtrC family response regulator